MKSMMARLSSVLFVAVFAVFGSVQAATIDTLFNTGVDSSGNVLNDSAADQHYTLTSTPAGYTGATTTMAISGSWPVNPWIGDNSDSRWIVPTSDRNTLKEIVGDYSFTTTFDLTGLDHTTAEITGQWAADNNVKGIWLNTTYFAITPFDNTADKYTDWVAFQLNSGFIAGENTLSFDVYNKGRTGGPNPIGLRVEMTGTATVVPVPAAVWLFGSGLLGMIGYSRRKAA